MHTTRPSLLIRLQESASDEAWSRFVELYTPLLYYWARRMHLSQDEATDLVQDVFVVLLQKLPLFEYDQSKSFRSWLRTVATNKWREKMRKPQPVLADDSEVNNLEDADNVEAFWESEYQQQLLRRALDIMQRDFDSATWKACWEFIVNGRSANDISAELGLTVNAVYLAKSRILRRLRQELDGLMD